MPRTGVEPRRDRPDEQIPIRHDAVERPRVADGQGPPSAPTVEFPDEDFAAVVSLGDPDMVARTDAGVMAQHRLGDVLYGAEMAQLVMRGDALHRTDRPLPDGDLVEHAPTSGKSGAPVNAEVKLKASPRKTIGGSRCPVTRR